MVAWQLVQLKKTDDEEMKGKIKRRIVGAMLIPLFVPVIMIIWLVLTLFGVI